VKLEHGQEVLGDTSCVIDLQGATITSWKIMGNEMLFVSDKASCELEEKALRGGIPIVFPQFGPGPLKQHGFARLVKWQMPVLPTVEPGTGHVTAHFFLTPTPFTKAMWDYDFTLKYSVMLKDMSLACQLEVNNTGEKPFNFTALLHTYFPVDNISNTFVKGLKGSSYIDKMDESEVKEEKNDLVKIVGETDRIYKKVKNDLEICDGGNASIILKRSNFDDVVVWNPWVDKSKKMSDFGDLEYQNMICVEAGAVVEQVVLQPGETWVGKQGLNLQINQKL